MPLLTPNYKLIAFSWGDVYSASADKERFTIIDSQFALLADIVGDGNISGWDVSVSDLNLREISVSSGWGLIDRFITRTYGSLFDTISNDVTTYIYMKMKEGMVGGYSRVSNISSLTYNDEEPPSSPQNVAISSTDAYHVLLNWDLNTEVDFSYYSIMRSTDDITFTEIGIISSNSYIDSTADQDTFYYYRVNAVDVNDNFQNSNSVSFSTLKDLDTPLNPIFYQVFSGNNLIQAIWTFSPSNNIRSTNGYKIVLQSLDSNYEVSTSSVIIERFVDSDENYIIVDDLSNNVPYRVTLYSVNLNGVLSDGLSLIKIPRDSSQYGEVSSVDINYREGVADDINIEMLVSWNFELDAYFDMPDRFLVTIIENGAKESEPIIVLGENSRNLNVKLLPFRNKDNDIFYESVKEHTNYSIIVQTSDEDGNSSDGIIVRSVSPIVKNPFPVTNLNIEQQSDLSLLVSWDNSISEFFSYNLAFCKITYFENNPSIPDNILLNWDNLYKANTYIIPNNLIVSDARYEFLIKAVDIEGNESYIKTIFFLINNEVLLEKPNIPEDQRISCVEGEIKLTWELMDTDRIKYYKIYRATYSVFLSPNNFSVIDTVPSIQYEYQDYDVNSDATYVYFITAVDIFGEESLNPVIDNYASYSLLIGSPRSSVSLPTPQNLVIDLGDTAADLGVHDVYLMWDNTGGDFDGYQILRSDLNKYSFKIVGNVSSLKNDFIDRDALIDDGIYYYLVRKFRNEADIFITESSVSPFNSIILAKIITYTENNGQQVIDIDTTVKRNIKNLEDPIKESVAKQLSTHTHGYTVDYDSRIDLNTSIIVTDWITSNFQKYITEDDISGAEQYIVKIDGNINSNFFKNSKGVIDKASLLKAESGFSPISYNVDSSLGTILFSQVLYSSLDNEISPYFSAPSVSLELVGVSEVKNELSVEHMEGLSATQIISGEINKLQLPDISHEGRINEFLIPVKREMASSDNFVYHFIGQDLYSIIDKNRIGTSIAFYDILKIKYKETELIAASSNGILFSPDNGNSWEYRFSAPTAIFKLFYSDSLGIYFALTNQGVYYRKGVGFSYWQLMEGTEYVKVIRDIVEDSSNNLYISTDLGVYKLKQDNAYIFFQWEQLSIFGPRSTEAYALLYDVNENRLLVSNELGLLVSDNEGSTWNFTSEFSEIEKIFQFIQIGNYIFALTNDEIWRKEVGRDFEKIIDLDADISRKMIIFNNILYISTSDGIFATQSYANIFKDVSLEILRVLPEINVKGNNVVVTSLNEIESLLYLGTDRRIFILEKNNNIWIQYDEKDTIIPSVYVGNVLQKLGFYYNNYKSGFQNISFDEGISFDARVEIVNEYNKYISQNKGWAIQKYNSKVNFRLNNNIVSESTDIVIKETLFSDFVFPIFNTLNSNPSTAQVYKDNTQYLIDNFTSSSATINDVSNIMNGIESFLSQLYPEARFIDGVPVVLPIITTNLYKDSGIKDSNKNIIYQNPDNPVTVDITNGVFTFEKVFDKYDILRVDILGSTLDKIGDLNHTELEDSFEFANSGLPSSLSQVQQSNIVKLGTFNEKKFPNQMTKYISNLQSKYIIPRDHTFYDVLNSTIDYEEEASELETTLSIPYPTTVSVVESEHLVFVGGDGGFLSINILNQEIQDRFITNVLNPVVKKILFYNDILYVVTEKNIYYSNDVCETWTKLDRTGLPNNLYTLGFIKENMVVGGSDGIYYKSFNQDGWGKAIGSSFPVEIIINLNLMFAVIDEHIYISSNGSNFIKTEYDVIPKINAIDRHKTGVILATNGGLYTDGGSFYGAKAYLSLVDVADSPDISSSLIFNDIGSSDSTLVAGSNNGDYYNLNNDIFTPVDSLLDTIHKIEVVDNQIWSFGYDLLKISTINWPIKITTGTPF